MKAIWGAIVLVAIVGVTLWVSRGLSGKSAEKVKTPEGSPAIERVRAEIQSMSEQRDKLTSLRDEWVKKLGVQVRESGSGAVQTTAELEKKDPIAASYVRQIQQLEERLDELTSRIIQAQSDLVAVETATILRKAGLEPSSNSPLQEAAKEIGVSKVRDVSVILTEAGAASYHAPPSPAQPSPEELIQKAEKETADMKRRMAEAEAQAQEAMNRAAAAERRFREEQAQAERDRAWARQYSPASSEPPKPQITVSPVPPQRTTFRISEDEAYSLPGGVPLVLLDDSTSGGAEVRIGRGPKLVLRRGMTHVFQVGGRRVCVALVAADLSDDSAEFETWAE